MEINIKFNMYDKEFVVSERALNYNIKSAFELTPDIELNNLTIIFCQRFMCDLHKFKSQNKLKKLDFSNKESAKIILLNKNEGYMFLKYNKYKLLSQVDYRENDISLNVFHRFHIEVAKLYNESKIFGLFPYKFVMPFHSRITAEESFFYNIALQTWNQYKVNTISTVSYTINSISVNFYTLKSELEKIQLLVAKCDFSEGTDANWILEFQDATLNLFASCGQILGIIQGIMNYVN